MGDCFAALAKTVGLCEIASLRSQGHISHLSLRGENEVNDAAISPLDSGNGLFYDEGMGEKIYSSIS